MENRKNPEARLRRFFAEPAALVFGQETAGQELERFSAALSKVIDSNPSGSIAVVAHGCVMALWVADRSGCDPFAFWRQMDLPSFAVFSKPDLKLVEVIGNVQ